MFHDARIEVVAGLFRWHMVFLRVVEEGFTIVEMRLPLGLLARIFGDALSQIASFVICIGVVLRRQLRPALT